MATPFEFPRPVRSAPGPVGPQPAAGPRPVREKPNVVKNGGGVNLNPSINLSFVKTSAPGPAHSGGSGLAGGITSGAGTPGSNFASNEDIQAFSEHTRKQARNRAVERAMDAEQLEAVLRNIPDTEGSMVGSRMRARRVSRHLKRIAKAEQEIAKAAAGLYAQFQREYESELSKVGKARPKQPPRFKF